MEVFDRAEIARKTAELYKKAALRFSEIQTSAYQGAPSDVLRDADEFLYQHDRMIRDLILDSSIRAYWRETMKTAAVRPRLTLVRMALSILKAAGMGSLKFVRRLDSQVREKERERLPLLSQSKPSAEQQKVVV